MVAKVFAWTDCTTRFVMASSSWSDVARAARSAGFGGVKAGDVTTLVSEDERRAAEGRPGVLLARWECNGATGEWGSPVPERLRPLF
ncbi:hypothetical protein [Frankia sp. R43]|uniref:hypothetical protein n=1 Tax=Frankia sp. R43 TaxID=269536 RepID=UPI00128FA8EB|nr:hypothetical protein [Frankia sp. R43]